MAEQDPRPDHDPAELEPDDSPAAAAEADMASVTDAEYFEALARLPAAVDSATGEPVDLAEGVRDERDHR